MFISIDAGGTNIRVAGAHELTSPVFVAEPLRHKHSHSFDKDLSYMVEASLELAGDEPVEAVGISTPGLLNHKKTELKSAKNLSSWAGKPLVVSLSKGFGGCPVFYDNDVIAAGLGEAYYGNTEVNFDYIIWGTGIGGGEIRFEEEKPKVETLSWRTYFSDWEADNGGAELAKRFGKAPEEFTAIDWESVERDFNRHLVSYLEKRRPKAVVFGGGLAVRHAELIKEVGLSFEVSIEVTKFGNDSGLMGGFGLIRNSLS